MTDYNIADLIKFAHEGKPNDFQSAFDSVAKDRIALAIDARREEIANQMMNGVEDESLDVEVEPEAIEADDDEKDSDKEDNLET